MKLLIMQHNPSSCYFFFLEATNVLHNYFTVCTVHLLLFCTVTNKCTINSQKSHPNMFRHYRVIFSEFMINA